MRWKQTPNWLRGGIIGAAGGLLLFGVGVATGGGIVLDQLIWWAPFAVILVLGPLGLCNPVVCQLEGVSFLHLITVTLGWGIVGAIIGWMMRGAHDVRTPSSGQSPS